MAKNKWREVPPVTEALFAFFGAITLGFAVVVVFNREVFRAVFALLGTLCGVAGMLALMGASTVAALQVLIYVGGVFVLFLFAVLVTDKPGEQLFRRSNFATGLGAVMAGTLGLFILVSVSGIATEPSPAAGGVTARAIGISFLTGNLLTFEAVSVLLLMGLAAAIVVIRKETME